MEANNVGEGLTIFCRVKAVLLSQPSSSDLRDHDGMLQKHLNQLPSPPFFPVMSPDVLYY